MKKIPEQIKEQMEISIEDFLLFYSKAYRRNNLAAMRQLYDKYPVTAKLALDDYYLKYKSEPADREYMYRYPITADSPRMTEHRIMDIIAYLLGTFRAPRHYRRLLQKFPYNRTFNFTISRYQKDFDRTVLWNELFLKRPELKKVIESRKIQSLDELIYRAGEYFDDYDSLNADSSHALNNLFDYVMTAEPPFMKNRRLYKSSCTEKTQSTALTELQILLKNKE